jgi:hypothetical protein
MKSETHIKIKESRRKYFQEVIQSRIQKEQPPEALNKETETTIADIPADQFQRSLHDLSDTMQGAAALPMKIINAFKWHEWRGKIPVVALPSIVSREQAGFVLGQIRRPMSRAGREITATRHRVASTMNQRAEKAITRFNDYMMVIFDA